MPLFAEETKDDSLIDVFHNLIVPIFVKGTRLSEEVAGVDPDGDDITLFDETRVLLEIALQGLQEKRLVGTDSGKRGGHASDGDRLRDGDSRWARSERAGTQIDLHIAVKRVRTIHVVKKLWGYVRATAKCASMNT